MAPAWRYTTPDHDIYGTSGNALASQHDLGMLYYSEVWLPIRDSSTCLRQVDLSTNVRRDAAC